MSSSAATENIGQPVRQDVALPVQVERNVGDRTDLGEHRKVLTVSQVPDPLVGRANPGPLGLYGFAITTFVLGLYECGAGLPGSNPEGKVGPDQVVFGLAIFMGGFAQFVAGCMEFACGNTFGTTVHCSYGAFWLSFAMFLIPSLGIEAAYGDDKRAYTFAIGIYLILWCFLTLLFFFAALKTNLAILGTFFFLALAYLFLSIANFIATEHTTQSVRLNKTGGAFAVICAFTAFWAGSNGLYLKKTTYVEVPVFGIPLSNVRTNDAGENGQVSREHTNAPAWKRWTGRGKH